VQKNIPTFILRTVAMLFAAAGILVCIFVLPSLGAAIPTIHPSYAIWQYPVFVGLYLAAVCFFYALIHFWLMLQGIDRDGLPSQKDMKAVRVSSIIFSIFYFVFAMPSIFMFAEADDAPGAIFIGAALGMIPIGAAAAIAILERIVKAAMPRRGERKPAAVSGL
jgi:succinate dehydrogenase hydrophobic anchor subunit